MKNNKVVNILKWVWLVVVVAAGMYYIAIHYQSALAYLYSIRPAGVILSVFFIIVSRLLNVDLIRESVKEVGWVPTFKEMFSLVSLTQLGKYIPGGIWQFAARFGAYKDNQLTVKMMGKAFFMENVWVVLGGMMSGVFFLLIGKSDAFLGELGILLTPSVKTLLVVLSIVLWVVGILFFECLFHKEKPWSLLLGRSIRLLISHALMYIAMGISFYFLFSDRSNLSIPFVIGGYALSYLVGYLAIFAPGGIGVREVVSVAIFSGVAPQAELAALTIVHRLLYTLVEFVMGLLGFIQSQKTIRSVTQPLHDSIKNQVEPTQPEDS